MSVLADGDGRVGSGGTGLAVAASELPKSRTSGISRSIRPIDAAHSGGKAWARSGKRQNTQFIVPRSTIERMVTLARYQECARFCPQQSNRLVQPKSNSKPNSQRLWRLLVIVSAPPSLKSNAWSRASLLGTFDLVCDARGIQNIQYLEPQL